MNSSVSKNTVVSIHYTLRDKNNEILETSSEETPLFYLHGHGQIIRGLEKALAGKNVGDQFSVTVSPEDGYGVYNPELVVELERKQFPPDADLSIGDMFEAALGDGDPVMIRITNIQDNNLS